MTLAADEWVSKARVAKHYVVRAKLQGSKGVAEIYSAERKEFMKMARKATA